MGRYIKKTEAIGGTSATAIQIPTSSNTSGPEILDDGMIRWNTDNQRIEFWYENQWLTVAKVGSVRMSQTQMQLLYKLGEYINNQMLITL